MGHRQQRTGERKVARAPYNFVPLVDGHPLEGALVDHDRYQENKHTGYFDVSLETITPLFVRGMITADDLAAEKESRNQPEPFMIEAGKPVIPGSSLRGMLHNLVGIITFGKMHFVSDATKIFFRAVAAETTDPLKESYDSVFGRFSRNVRAGYVEYENGRWYIRPAERLSGKSFLKVKDHVKPDKKSKFATKLDVDGLIRITGADYRVQSYEVCFQGKGEKVTHVYTPSSSETPTATLVCTGNMAETSDDNQTGNVQTERVNYTLIGLSVGNKKKWLPIGQQVVDDYLDGLTAFQKEEPYFHKERGILQRGKPIFYIEENGEVIHFGHTPNFRIAHITTELDGKKRAVTPRDLVPEKLLDSDIVDYTEAMFGYVSDERNERGDLPVAYAGRISVTSATLDAENRVGEPQTDVIYGPKDALKRTPGSPKPTTFQHYLEQPDGIRTEKPDLHHYGTSGAVIRGHKMFWRQDANIDTLKADNSDGSKPNIETTFYPVKTGTCFSFRVYFENLTDSELGALAWALTLDDDPAAYHMLGMGKPYGLGVAKLTAWLVLSQRHFHPDRPSRYEKLFEGNGEWYTSEQDADYGPFIDAFKAVIDTHTGRAFDDNGRIQQLKAMLRLYTADPAKFSYMQLGGESGQNEYKDRPVLPWPDEVVK